MEKETIGEQYKGGYFGIRRVAKDVSQPAFMRQGLVQQLSTTYMPAILSRMEETTGPLYAFSQGSVPKRWQAVLTSLFHRHLINSPAPFFPLQPNDSPKLITASLLFSGDSSVSEHFSARGVGFYIDEALAKAVGEFLERYCLMYQHAAPFVAASYQELSRTKSALNLSLLASSRRIKPTSSLAWVPGKTWEGEEILLPAQCVFWNYGAMPGREGLFREPNTNGAAGMYDLSGAILHGLRELIQRDAFLLFWLTRTAPPRIEIPSIPDEEVQDILTKMHRYRLGVELLNITSDIGLPAFAAVIMDTRQQPPFFALGAGCQGDTIGAAKAALVEALGVYNASRCMPDDHWIAHPSLRPKSVRERLSLWRKPAMMEKFSWFLQGKRKKFKELSEQLPSRKDTAQEMEFLAKRFSQLGEGYEILYYDASHPVLSEVAYRVVKVIVPAFLPIYLSESYLPRANSRIAASLAHVLPHPFP